ncbi:hypothetical protein GCM10011247_46180 [Pseudomonas plecoglossicida]|nr:hypothetical protein GCM10011247_46180 [Pseudomonas plecoglossicida]
MNDSRQKIKEAWRADDAMPALQKTLKTSKGNPYPIRKLRAGKVATIRVMATWYNPLIITYTRQMAHYDLYEHFCQCGPRVFGSTQSTDRQWCS